MLTKEDLEKVKAGAQVVSEKWGKSKNVHIVPDWVDTEQPIYVEFESTVETFGTNGQYDYHESDEGYDISLAPEQTKRYRNWYADIHTGPIYYRESIAEARRTFDPDLDTKTVIEETLEGENLIDIKIIKI